MKNYLKPFHRKRNQLSMSYQHCPAQPSKRCPVQLSERASLISRKAFFCVVCIVGHGKSPAMKPCAVPAAHGGQGGGIHWLIAGADSGVRAMRGQLLRQGARPRTHPAYPGFAGVARNVRQPARSVLKMNTVIRPVRAFLRQPGIGMQPCLDGQGQHQRAGLALRAIRGSVLDS